MATKREVESSEIGQQFFYGEGRKKSYEKAFPYLLVAAEAGEMRQSNPQRHKSCGSRKLPR
jgi:hypothetical protein